MKKKLLSLFGILTLIFTLGLSNVYAVEDWNFEFRSQSGEALDTVWEFHFSTPMESVDVDGGAISAYVDPNVTSVVEVVDWSGGWHGGPNPLPNDPYSGPGGYAQNPGGVTNWGHGYLTNMSGDQGPDGPTWNAGMFAHIATYTFDIATDINFADMYEDTFMGFAINNVWWDEQSNDTGDRMTSPGVLWDVDGSTAWGMTSVPVPGAIWLLGSGMLGLFGINKRKKK